jgi:hypothetical protein
MLYGAPRQAIDLATDLRTGAREAAERERTGSAAAQAAVERPITDVVSHGSLLVVLRRRLARPSAAHAGAR